MELVMSMTVDCLMGKGTADRATYVANLHRIAAAIDNLPGNSNHDHTRQND